MKNNSIQFINKKIKLNRAGFITNHLQSAELYRLCHHQQLLQVHRSEHQVEHIFRDRQTVLDLNFPAVSPMKQRHYQAEKE